MKKTLGIIITILGVALLATGGVMMILSSGPKKSNRELFTEAVDKSFGLFKDNDKEESESELGKVIEEIEEKLSTNIHKLTINGKFTEGESGYTKFDGTLYFGQDQFYIKSSIDSNDKVSEIEGLLKNNRAYFYIKDVLSKFYYIDGISSMMGNQEVTKLVEKVIGYLTDSLKESIKDEDIVIEDAELNINSKTYKTTKYGYSFTGSALYDLLVSFANKIKNDKEIVDALNGIIQSFGDYINLGEFKLDETNFSAFIDELLEYAKELKSLGKLATYSAYMYDDEVISRQLTIYITSEQGSMPIELVDYKVKEDGKTYYKLAAKMSIQELFSLEVKQVSDSESTISIKYMGKEVATGKYVKTSEGIEISLTSDNDDMTIDFELKINNDNTGSLELDVNDTTFSIDYKLEEVDSFPEVDVENSAPYTEMTEEEQEALERLFRMFSITSINDKALLESSNNIAYKEQKELVDDSLNYNIECTTDEDGTINCSGLGM